VVWANEEGCRYAPGCTGSLVFSTRHTIEELWDATAPDGAVLKDELERTLVAVTPDAEHRCGGIAMAGYIEAHIEQGPRLESEGLMVGAVTGIQGGSSFEVRVTGIDGHAGTVPLGQRRDAFRSAHAIIDALHRDLADPTDTVRFTVGSLPSLSGVARHDPRQGGFHDRLPPSGTRVFRPAHASPCEVSVSRRHAGDPADFDPGVIASVERIAGEPGIPAMAMPSGADRDARSMVPCCPTGMIVVPSTGGIGHNEDERATPAGLAAGCRVLANALYETAKG